MGAHPDGLIQDDLGQRTAGGQPAWDGRGQFVSGGGDRDRCVGFGVEQASGIAVRPVAVVRDFEGCGAFAGYQASCPFRTAGGAGVDSFWIAVGKVIATVHFITSWTHCSARMSSRPRISSHPTRRTASSRSELLALGTFKGVAATVVVPGSTLSAGIRKSPSAEAAYPYER